MSKVRAGKHQQQLRNSYVTTIISISLVLFVLGIMGLLLLNAKKISEFVKENITFSVFIKDKTKEVEIRRLQKDLDASYFVKSTHFISKSDAAQMMKSELGNDFIEFLGYNPLLASVDVKLKANYANPDSVVKIINNIEKNKFVEEVYYQKSLVHTINENVRNIGIILLLFSGLLFAIAITLINNTIRLSIYSKRFIINTMQLVGATRRFIRKPFLYRSLSYGLIGSFISLALLSGVIFWVQNQISEVIGFHEINLIGILYAAVIFSGILISILAAFFAVNKYLNINIDKLYY